MVPHRWRYLTEVLRRSELDQEVCGWKGCIIAVTCLYGYQHHQHALLAALSSIKLLDMYNHKSSLPLKKHNVLISLWLYINV